MKTSLASRSLWVDNTGVLRINTTPPVEDGGTTSDTSGTVVGTQTSSRLFKRDLGLFSDYAGAIERFRHLPLHTWLYLDGPRPADASYMGIFAEEAPWAAMDPDDEHPQGRAFNPASAFGYTAAAIKQLDRRLTILEGATNGDAI